MCLPLQEEIFHIQQQQMKSVQLNLRSRAHAGGTGCAVQVHAPSKTTAYMISQINSSLKEMAL